MKVAKKTDFISTIHEVILHNATIFIEQWADEDDENRRCLVDGFKKVSDGSVRRKKLFVLLHKEVYVKLPRTCLTKAGGKKKLNDLRARDYLSKGRGGKLNKLLARTGLRPNTIQGDNNGQVSSTFAHTHMFAITAQENLQAKQRLDESVFATKLASDPEPPFAV